NALEARNESGARPGLGLRVWPSGALRSVPKRLGVLSEGNWTRSARRRIRSVMSVLEFSLLRISREGRIGLFSAQQVERILKLHVVLGFRRHIGEGAGTFFRLV